LVQDDKQRGHFEIRMASGEPRQIKTFYIHGDNGFGLAIQQEG
jgi:hypothetical protein